MFQNSSGTIPVTLTDSVIHLREGGGADAAARPGVTGPGLWTIAAVHAERDADLHSDVWERHPDGNEILCAMSGAFEVRLRAPDDGPDTVAALVPGRPVIVPVGGWHRLTVTEPGDLLAVTPRTGTVHERAARRRQEHHR